MTELTQAQKVERAIFEREMGDSPWAKEYQARFGEPPNLYAPEYDMLNAWRHQVQPQRDPYDNNSLHWPSRLPDGTWLKSQDHPTAWKEQAMNATGVNPDAAGLTKDAWAEAAQAEAMPNPAFQTGIQPTALQAQIDKQMNQKRVLDPLIGRK